MNLWDTVTKVFRRNNFAHPVPSVPKVEAPKPWSEPPTNEVVMKKLKKGECPDCGANEFIMGPQGGMSQNIECTKCGSDFNCGPFDSGWIGEPITAERIGWNNSGRWARPGQLKEGERS